MKIGDKITNKVSGLTAIVHDKLGDQFKVRVYEGGYWSWWKIKNCDFCYNESVSEPENSFGCKGNSIRLRSGKYFDFANPDVNGFSFGDIACGVARSCCRFDGQQEVGDFYSVAEHLIHCATVAIADGYSLEETVATFMHDAHEAFYHDISKPFKLLLPDYQKYEQQGEDLIGKRYNIDFKKHHDRLKKIDREMLICERKQLFHTDIQNNKWSGQDDVRQLDVKLHLWDSKTAELEFFRMASKLGVI